MADGKSTSKFSGKKARNQLQKAARRKFGRGNVFTLFERAAQALGEPWPYAGVQTSGSASCDGPTRTRMKREGYELLRKALSGEAALLPVDRPAPKSKRARVFAQTDAFLLGWEWRTLRMRVLKAFGARCQCCGATAKDGVRIHVDHIKPRSTHPELALVEANLQVLCDVCNQGKGAWDDTDWREEPPVTMHEFAPVWRTKQ